MTSLKSKRAGDAAQRSACAQCGAQPPHKGANKCRLLNWLEVGQREGSHREGVSGVLLFPGLDANLLQWCFTATLMTGLLIFHPT